MKIKEYLQDKLIFLCVNFIIFLILSAIIYNININNIFILLLFIFWFLPLISYILLDYFKYKKFFTKVDNILNNLDKKFLLPEVVNESNFFIFNEINNILKIVSRDMHENINYYKSSRNEYKEYIETWVHEIKTPIASSKLIIENNENEITKIIDAQLDKIEEFVEQVLYYSKIDSLEKDYIIKKTNLKEVVCNVIKRNSREFIIQHIKLELEILDTYVYTDSKWIEFIINQIIINSIKYKKINNSIINIKIEQQKNNIILYIKDNGIGISKKDINKIFEKGYTGINGRKYCKSTGIGLYLCKKLCDKLGIKIIVESIENEETTVKLIFCHLEYFDVLN
nr:ATP-binding protein [uncultured Tyzzerella sp.]